MLPADIAAAVRHHWWLFLLRGVAGVAFGVLTLWWPGATLVVLMAFIAAYALVDGIVALVYAFRLRPLFDRWWMLLIQGVISAVFGVLAIFQPGLSVAYIVVSVALWMLVAGLVQLLLARGQKAMGGSGRWSVVGGILSLVLAAAAVVYPRVTVAAVLVLIAWFALAVGIVQLVVAFRVRSIVKAAAAV
jgi:uncharacterized membrane protein HdeD (DUF308 family)